MYSYDLDGCLTLQWRHNDHDSVSNHQPHGCLLNRLFRRRSKETSKLRVTGLCVGNSPGPVNSPHKGPVTRKMFPFDDVIMTLLKSYWCINSRSFLAMIINSDDIFKQTLRPPLSFRRKRNFCETILLPYTDMYSPWNLGTTIRVCYDFVTSIFNRILQYYFNFTWEIMYMIGGISTKRAQ